MFGLVSTPFKTIEVKDHRSALNQPGLYPAKHRGSKLCFAVRRPLGFLCQEPLTRPGPKLRCERSNAQAYDQERDGDDRGSCISVEESDQQDRRGQKQEKA